MVDKVVVGGGIRRHLAMTSALMVAMSPLSRGAAQEQTASIEREAGDTPRVTVNLKDEPLLTALRAIANEAKLSPVYDESMIPSLRVTVRLREAKVSDAFEEVLTGTGLIATVQSTRYVSIRRSPRPTAPVSGGISGRVTDAERKKGVMGAAVTLEGTPWSVRTSDDGTFRIANVSPGRYTMVVRRLGFGVVRKLIEVSDNSMAPADIVLTQAATPLEQVVTTVTGAQRRLELGNAIGVIKADSLVKEAPITSISQLLTARVPGLRVSQSQGTVGGNVSLQIRGQTSLSLSSEPIVIIDGIRYTSQAVSSTGARGERVSPLNDLNPNDIATVEVVKGPSAATLYGTDAAHGVIVITTKRGEAGPPRYTAFAKGMTDEIPRRNAADDGGYYTYPGYCSLYDMGMGWCTQDSVKRIPNALANSQTSFLSPARSWGYGTTVSGGSSNLRYYFSGTRDELEGGITLPAKLVDIFKRGLGVSKVPEQYLRPNAQTLSNIRSSMTAALGQKFDLTASGGYTNGNTRSVSDIGAYSPFYSASYDYGMGLDSDSLATALQLARDNFARTTTEDNNRFVSNVQGQARPMSWLSVRGTVGLDFAMRGVTEFAPRDSTRNRFGQEPKGYIMESRNRQKATSADYGATATFQRGPFSFRSSIGGQYVHTLTEQVRGTGRDLPPGVASISRARTTTSTQSFTEAVTLGNYFEEMIGINERLFLSGALRVDGASAFGYGYRAAAYPKISASWLVSQEPFMPRIPALDELRVRTALGVSGQQAQPTWALPTWDVSNDADGSYASAGYGRPVVLLMLANPKLRPERGQELEAGLDAGWFNRRVQTELTWYKRRTRDQIIIQGQPDGIPSQRANVGLTTEHGFEAQLSTILVDHPAFHWQVMLQHSSFGTKLVRVGPTKGIQLKQPEGGYVEGYPLGARFIVPLLGYGDTNNDGWLQPDEVQLGDTLEYAGVNTMPNNQTLNTTVGLFRQRLRVSALFDRQSGGTMIDMRCDGFGSTCRATVDRTAPLVDQALIIARRKPTDGLPSYIFAQDVRFVRLREVSAALTVPSRFLRTVRATSGSVTLSARNLGLWTNFTGTDPETSPIRAGSSPTLQVKDRGYPQSRTWALRVDLGL